jgi:hypothetical protein
MVSSSGGTFRFLNLANGTYSLKCELSGFKTYVREPVIIRVGDNFDLPIVLETATIEEEVTVVATSPIVDTKKTGTAFNFTEVMLQEVPTARDPWAVMQQAPGIMMTNENVGGIDSAFQGQWTSKGTVTGYFGNYNLDGVNVTDMDAIGSSSRFYDFDSFEEIQVVTTGQDPSIRTGGVSINVVTRRGGNKLEALGRIFFTNDRLQADNRPQDLIDTGYPGDQVNRLSDYGFQAGGPILKNRIWFWLGYGVQDIRLLSINGDPQNSKIVSFNGKLNFTLGPRDRGELAFVTNDKSVFNLGAGPYRPPETTVNQVGNGNPLAKLEYEHMFSDSFLTVFKFAYSWGRFRYDPNGGLDTQGGYDYVTHKYSGTFEYLRGHKPSLTIQADGNGLLEGFLGGNHELRFGAEYRMTPISGERIYPGGVWKYYWDGVPMEAELYRSVSDSTSDRFSLYVNDAYSLGRLTLNLGLRVDRENYWHDTIEVPANPIGPEIMPAFTFPRANVGVILWTLSPRLGLTFDLTGDGKTILRASLARYGFWPDNLAQIMSVTENNRAWYEWNDLNGDDLVSQDELVGYPFDGLLAASGYDPFDPTNPVSRNEIDKDLSTGLIDEILFGMEREISGSFALGASITLRRLHSWNRWVSFNPETGQRDSREDWGDPIPGSITIDGRTYDYEYWAPTTHALALPNQVFERWPNWSMSYAGLEITAVKRLSRRWMMNASLTTNIEWFDGGYGWNDSRWMAKISFLYQLPWGFNLSGFANAREGMVSPQVINVYTPERRAKGYPSSTQLHVEKYGDTRLPDFYNANLSLSKDLRLGRYGKLTAQIDAFNIFNFNHVLARNNILTHPSYGETWKILNPRIIRLGLRYRL